MSAPNITGLTSLTIQLSNVERPGSVSVEFDVCNWVTLVELNIMIADVNLVKLAIDTPIPALTNLKRLRYLSTGNKPVFDHPDAYEKRQSINYFTLILIAAKQLESLECSSEDFTIASSIMPSLCLDGIDATMVRPKLHDLRIRDRDSGDGIWVWNAMKKLIDMKQCCQFTTFGMHIPVDMSANVATFIELIDKQLLFNMQTFVMYNNPTELHLYQTCLQHLINNCRKLQTIYAIDEHEIDLINLNNIRNCTNTTSSTPQQLFTKSWDRTQFPELLTVKR